LSGLSGFVRLCPAFVRFVRHADSHSICDGEHSNYSTRS
jgi:hypothetical protein